MSAQHGADVAHAVIEEATGNLHQQIKSRLIELIDTDLTANLQNCLQDAVQAALVKQNAHISQQSIRDFSDELKNIRDKLDQLKARYEGLKHENAIQRRSLEALAPILDLEDSPSAETQANTVSRMIPFETYEAAVRQNKVLRKQLQECSDQRKNEATARSMLISRIRSTKESIRQWEEFGQRWQKWRAKREAESTPNRLQTPVSELEKQYFRLPEFGDLDAALQRDGDKLGISRLLQYKDDRREDAQNPLPNAQTDLVDQQGRRLIAAGTTSILPPKTIIQEEAMNTTHDGLGNVSNLKTRIPTSRLPASSAPSNNNEPAMIRSADPEATVRGETRQTTHLAPPSVPDPEVSYVSDRRLKRRHGKDQPRSSDSHLYIKREPLSSSVAGIDLSLFRPESLDLDEVGGVVDTPRKRRRLRMLQDASRAISNQPLRTERSMSEPLKDTQSLDRSQAVRGSAAPLITNASTSNARIRDVLKPRPANVVSRVLRDHGSDTGVKVRSKLSKKDRQFMQFADDEDEDENEENMDPAGGAMGEIRKDTARLAAMLNLPVTSTKKNWKQQSHVPVISTPRRTNPARRVHLPANTATKPKLRDKPVQALNLGDFKYNMGFNHGNDPDKSKHARQCRPGCTDSRCCGEAMRAIAKSMPFLKVTRPPFASEEGEHLLTDDQYLVKWHLGSTWSRGMVERMAAADFEELVLTARTALLAQRYGRHKEEHEKRQTPPGYWQMSMPSTQELSLQHNEAAEIEAGLIRDRWNEAKKANGRWRFIDE